jgi:hypothetical protein
VYGTTTVTSSAGHVGHPFATLPYVDVRAYGVSTTAIAAINNAGFVAAIAAVPDFGVLLIPPGIYRGHIKIRRNNITIWAPGVTIRAEDNVAGAWTVLEIGEIEMGSVWPPGPAAFDNVNVLGFPTLDGNKNGTIDPGNDLNGWGIATTNVSHGHYDVKAINCWNGGVGTFIWSDYNFWNAYIENCGFGAQNEPGFDVNSSNYNHIKATVKDSNYGFRLLDNCHGNEVDVVIRNPSVLGVMYFNQPVNSSKANIIRATVVNGAGEGAMMVGSNVFSSQMYLVTDNVSGYGLRVFNQDGAAYNSKGNYYNVATKGSGLQSVILETDFNRVDVSSYQDGRSGGEGANFAIDVSGDNNVINAILEDTVPWKVRGVIFRTGTKGNQLATYRYNNTLDPYNDDGTNNSFISPGFGDNVASANEIVPPLYGSVFYLTGTNTVATIYAYGRKGRTITFISTDNVTINNGSNLKLNGNWVSGAANATLTLVGDGTNWYEISRSLN